VTAVTAVTAVIRDVFDRHMEGETSENIELIFRRAHPCGGTDLQMQEAPRDYVKGHNF